LKIVKKKIKIGFRNLFYNIIFIKCKEFRELDDQGNVMDHYWLCPKHLSMKAKQEKMDKI